MEKVVPVLAEAVASIIQHSTTQTFKMKCTSLLQVIEPYIYIYMQVPVCKYIYI